MYRRNITLVVGCLTLTFVMVVSFAPFTGAQSSGDVNNSLSRKSADAPAKWQRPSPRELMLSEGPEAELRLFEKEHKAAARARRSQARDAQLAKSNSAQSVSSQHQSAGATSASSTASNVRLTFRDVGPETGFSGSGSGFTFNRDTRQIILPSPGRVFRSVNGGSIWSPLDYAVGNLVEGGEFAPLSTDGSFFVRQDPRNPQLLYAVAAHGGQLSRSNDFGTTWTQLEDSRPGRNFDFADIAVHEASSNVVFALRKTSDELFGPALWRSEDGGATFTPQWNSGLPQETFDPDTFEGCVPFYSNIATTPADPNVVYVVQLSGDNVHCPPAVHKSIDGGLTFTRLEATGPGTPIHLRPTSPIQVFPHPTRSGVLFVQTIHPDSTIYRSMDGGASFRLLTGGLPKRQHFFVSFDRNDPLLVYVAGRGGVFRSQDGGDTFQPLGLTAEQLGTFATNVNVDPSNSNVIFVNTWNGNFKSANGGVTFQAINNGWKAASIRAIAFDNGANPTLYLATDHGIMRTSTRGHHYERVPGPSVLNDTRLLAVAPSNPNMILAVAGPVAGPFDSVALYRTLDGGQSWTESSVATGQALPAEIAVDPHNSSNVYFVGSVIDPLGELSGRGFYRSVDAGATFEKTFDQPFLVTLAIDPIHPNVIFAGISCSNCPWPLFKSVDGGLSFAHTSLRHGFTQVVTEHILIDPQNPDNIFLNGGEFFFLLNDPDQGGHYVLRSTDGGITFSPADPGVHDLFGRLTGCQELVMNAEDPARLYCLTQLPFGLAVTGDSGNTWSLVRADEIVKLGGFGPTMMVIYPKRPNLLYLLGSSLLEVEVHDN